MEDEMVWIGLIWFRVGTSVGLLWTRKWTFGFHKMLGSSWVAAQLAVFEEELSSVSEWVVLEHIYAGNSNRSFPNTLNSPALKSVIALRYAYSCSSTCSRAIPFTYSCNLQMWSVTCNNKHDSPHTPEYRNKFLKMNLCWGPCELQYKTGKISFWHSFWEVDNVDLDGK
jgi:hypothetical protein